MKNFWKNDRDAIIILLVIIIVCLLLLPYVNDFIGGKSEDVAVDAKKEKAEGKTKGKKDDGYYYVEEKQGELFVFDPNTADSTQLLRLGLRPWQVKNIYKYRAAGGRYNKPTDFARLYGLTLKQYKRLEPYIRIVPEVMAADVYASDDRDMRKNSRDSSAYVPKISQGEKIDINAADTSLLKRIPGIGSYYAKQIVGKRTRLGGFASVSQLKEIEGFPESSLQYMMVGNASSDGKKSDAGIAMVRINRLDVKELARHPYIRYVQAKEIFSYRRLRGPITSVSDLSRLPSFTPEEIKRLEPYIDFSK